MSALYELAISAGKPDEAKDLLEQEVVETLCKNMGNSSVLFPATITCLLQLGNQCPQKVYDKMGCECLLACLEHVCQLNVEARDPILSLCVGFLEQLSRNPENAKELGHFVSIICLCVNKRIQVFCCMVFLIRAIDTCSQIVKEFLRPDDLLAAIESSAEETQINALIVARLLCMSHADFDSNMVHEGLAETLEKIVEVDALQPYVNKILGGLMFGNHRAKLGPVVCLAVRRPVDEETDQYLVCAVHYLCRFDRSYIGRLVTEDLVARAIKTPSKDIVYFFCLAISDAETRYEGAWNPYVHWIKDNGGVEMIQGFSDTDTEANRLLTRWFS